MKIEPPSVTWARKVLARRGETLQSAARKSGLGDNTPYTLRHGKSCRVSTLGALIKAIAVGDGPVLSQEELRELEQVLLSEASR